jgi:DNA-binding winged helix-turn-helix (wHTH) protein
MTSWAPNAEGPKSVPDLGLTAGADVLRFRNFTLTPGARLLLRGSQPVEIGSRAFDLLTVLARSRGRVVDRVEIIRQVWPTTVVEECNLRFQVSCLRRALGEHRDLVKTVPGRGYMLALDVGTDLDDVAQPTPRPDKSGEELRGLLREVLAELRGGRTSPPDDLHR